MKIAVHKKEIMYILISYMQETSKISNGQPSFPLATYHNSYKTRYSDSKKQRENKLQ